MSKELTENPGFDLSSVVAVVTGASRGIGREIARYLAGLNARVALWSRDENELSRTCGDVLARGGTATAIRADVTSGAEVEAALDHTEQALGAVTLLVNNAGRAHCIGPVWETEADDWWNDVEVNLRGTFLCSRAVLKRMIGRSHGRVINVSSGAGNMTLPMASSYACSKAAVQRLTDCLAAGAKPYGVSVFAISPGPTRTAMTQHILESDAGRKWMPEFQKIPQDQWTPPELIGKLVATLAAGRADVLTGRFIHLRKDVDELVASIDEIQAKDLYTLRLRE